MAENRSAFEFLSMCWVPFIAPEQRIYYACGNTRMHDFLRDFNVSREMDILVLGLGDVRHIMATVAGLSQRPPSSAGKVEEIRFHLNDVDQHVIARDVILLEIMNALDPESKSDVEFLWSVWYDAFIFERDLIRFKTVLGELIDKYSNSSRENERICKFGDKQSLTCALKTWNCWLNRKLNQKEIKRDRLKALKDAGRDMLFDDSNIAKYASMQTYIDRGIKESDVKIVGKEMLTAAKDGFVNFSPNHKGRKDFVNPTLMRPGSDEWLVEDGAHAAASYLPLQKEFFDEHSTVHEACFEKMRQMIFSYLKSWKLTKMTYTFWATDLFHLCHWLLPSDMMFDFIFTSNLMDHVGLLNLLLIVQPRLKTSRSMVLTESHNWNEHFDTLEEFYSRELRCNHMLLPSMIGLKLAEDFSLGTSQLQGFYRTMYGRQSDTELIYWTKSCDQKNISIDLKGSPKIKEALNLLLISTLWSKLTTTTTSSFRQTPLALMYCFQRLQHLIRGGMATLLDYVELVMSDPSTDFSRNRITWDVVCWAFGLKDKRDKLSIVKLPFKDVNSRLATITKNGKLVCRLRLDYNNASNRQEVLSLIQYDAVGQHFQVPILESAWNALPEDATISVFDIDSDESPSLSLLQELSNRKVLVKRVGKVTATYNQPKQIDAAATDSDKFIICYEDVEEYRLPKAVGAETYESFDFLCQLNVSRSKNITSLDSTTDVDLPYKFSCAVDSYEIKQVDENHIQAILFKQKSFNTGRTALLYRLIDDSELLPFTSGQDIKKYLEETMICDLMFCTPTDIKARAKAFNGSLMVTEDAFLVLRLVIEYLWQLGSKKDKSLQPTLELEIQKPTKPSSMLILDVEGYYMFDGFPLVKMRSMEIDRNSATPGKDATKIYVKDRKCLELLKKMLFTNSLRVSQEGSSSFNTRVQSSQSLNTFLQMVFPNGNGEDMASALHAYPSNIGVVKSYIDKIYSASIRQNFVARIIATRLQRKQMMEMIASFSAKTVRPPSGTHNSTASMTPKHSTSLPLKQQTSCSECKKATTDLKKCSRCKTVAYCSKECQMKDWPKHKKECSALLKTDDGSKTTAPKSKDGSEEESALKPKTKSHISKSKNDGSGASATTTDGDNTSKIEIKDDGSNVGSLTEEETKRDNSGTQSKYQPSSKSAEKMIEIRIPLKFENPFQPHNLEKVKVNDRNDAMSVGPRSVELCLYCRLEKTTLMKCNNCKCAAYCSRECQRADWKRHKPECQTQQIPSAQMIRCNGCGVLGTEMKKCSQCKSASYCSLECQRTEWKSHKTICRQP